MKKKIVNLNQDTFDKVIEKAEKILIIDFWADWCNPCKMIAPLLEEVASEINNKNLYFAKLNIDDYPNVASKYNIKSIPTIGIFKNGKLINTKAGLLSKKEIRKFIDDNI